MSDIHFEKPSKGQKPPETKFWGEVGKLLTHVFKLFTADLGEGSTSFAPKTGIRDAWQNITTWFEYHGRQIKATLKFSHTATFETTPEKSNEVAKNRMPTTPLTTNKLQDQQTASIAKAEVMLHMEGPFTKPEHSQFLKSIEGSTDIPSIITSFNKQFKESHEKAFFWADERAGATLMRRLVFEGQGITQEQLSEILPKDKIGIDYVLNKRAPTKTDLTATIMRTPANARGDMVQLMRATLHQEAESIRQISVRISVNNVKIPTQLPGLITEERMAARRTRTVNQRIKAFLTEISTNTPEVITNRFEKTFPSDNDKAIFWIDMEASTQLMERLSSLEQIPPEQLNRMFPESDDLLTMIRETRKDRLEETKKKGTDPISERIKGLQAYRQEARKLEKVKQKEQRDPTGAFFENVQRKGAQFIAEEFGRLFTGDFNKELFWSDENSSKKLMNRLVSIKPPITPEQLNSMLPKRSVTKILKERKDNAVADCLTSVVMKTPEDARVDMILLIKWMRLNKRGPVIKTLQDMNRKGVRVLHQFTSALNLVRKEQKPEQTRNAMIMKLGGERMFHKGLILEVFKVFTGRHKEHSAIGAFVNDFNETFLTDADKYFLWLYLPRTSSDQLVRKLISSNIESQHIAEVLNKMFPRNERPLKNIERSGYKKRGNRTQEADFAFIIMNTPKTHRSDMIDLIRAIDKKDIQAIQKIIEDMKIPNDFVYAQIVMLLEKFKDDDMVKECNEQIKKSYRSLSMEKEERFTEDGIKWDQIYDNIGK